MNEFEPQARPSEYIDVLRKLKQGDFFLGVNALEEYLQIGRDEDVIQSMLDDLRNSFGKEYEGYSARIRCRAFIQYDSETIGLQPQPIESNDLLFAGLAIKQLNSQQRVVLNFPDLMRGIEYYTLPETVTRLEIETPEYDNTIKTTLQNHIQYLHQYFETESFRQLSVDRQHVELRRICNIIFRELQVLTHYAPVDISYLKHYIIFDEELSQEGALTDFDNCSINPPETRPQKSCANIIDVTFMEQLGSAFVDDDVSYLIDNNHVGGWSMKSASEMPLSGGVPCLVLRNATTNADITLVQFDQILSITPRKAGE